MLGPEARDGAGDVGLGLFQFVGENRRYIEVHRPRRQLASRHQGGDLGVLEHRTESGGRIGRVEWHVGGPRPMDAEDCGDHQRRPVEKEADAIGSADTPLAERPGNLQRRLMQIAVAPVRVGADDRGCLRRVGAALENPRG